MVMGFLAVIVAVIAAGLAWLVVATHAQASSHVGPGQVAGSSLTRVVVRPGQSLWSIASREDPTADPREVIQQIIDANSLGGTGIRVGQVIWVPRG